MKSPPPPGENVADVPERNCSKPPRQIASHTSEPMAIRGKIYVKNTRILFIYLFTVVAKKIAQTVRTGLLKSALFRRSRIRGSRCWQINVCTARVPVDVCSINCIPTARYSSLQPLSTIRSRTVRRRQRRRLVPRSRRP